MRSSRYIPALLVLLLSVAGCGAGGGSTSKSKVLTFAGINALTGQSAVPGTDSQDGLEEAATLMNKAGGVTDNCGNKYTINITSADMANDPTQAIALLRGAAADTSVLAVIGPTPSTGFVPMVPVAGSLNMPLIGIGTAPIPQWNKYVYRVSIPASTADAIMWKKLASTFHIDKMAIIYDQSQNNSVEEANVARSLAAQLGYTITDVETDRAGDQDFTTQLQKMNASGATWIGDLAGTAEVPKIALQLRHLGMHQNIVTTSGNFIVPTLWDQSQGAFLGGYTWTTYNFNTASATAKNFFAAYMKAFGKAATLQSIWGYDSLVAAINAVKRSCTGTNREKFVNALSHTTNAVGLEGVIKFNNPPTGENQNPIVYTVKTTGRGTFSVVS